MSWAEGPEEIRLYEAASPHGALLTVPPHIEASERLGRFDILEWLREENVTESNERFFAKKAPAACRHATPPSTHTVSFLLLLMPLGPPASGVCTAPTHSLDPLHRRTPLDRGRRRLRRFWR